MAEKREQKQKNARQVALEVLLRCEGRNAWSDAALKDAVRQAGLSPQDSALCSRICYGVQQNRLLLDSWLAWLSTVAPEKMEPPLRVALWTGLYQIALLDRIPDSAAVNETVKLCRSYCRNPHSAKLANGILRSFCRRRGELPQPESLSVAYSHPQWLVDCLGEALGEGGDLEGLLRANNAQPGTTIQTNTLRTTPEALLEELRRAEVQARPHPWLPGCLELSGTGDLERLDAFRRGDFFVQDAAARLAVLAAEPQPGMRVLDCCGAPGGKTFSAALLMGDEGSILSCDIHPGKVKLISAGAARLGLKSVTSRLQNAKEFDPALEGAFDLVIADVPCSGLGIIRKKPDIREKDPAQLAGLPQVQRAILDNVSRYVKPGGRLLYATCTVLKRENEDVVTGFLSCHSDFALEPLPLSEPVGPVKAGMLTLWPHIHGTDGFFMARLCRRERSDDR
ncbi:MAG: 16S rRNA (cytosine(967)-C(5))-methyltransferase RsmB [Clostridiales bacterium]|nr:16S rRNA (cytosine(967)-C(5))-methyltransferase RsmB [Clostridiales bacterium]